MKLSRRGFLGGAAAASAAVVVAGPKSTLGQSGAKSSGAAVDVATKDLTHSAVAKVQWKAEPFAMTDVRLLPGFWKESMELNRSYLYSLPNDRLAHNFPCDGGESFERRSAGRLGSGLTASCAGTTSGITSRPARCCTRPQAMSRCASRRTIWWRMLAAVPGQERLPERVSYGGIRPAAGAQGVWAPFYTYHKIMAGHIDMY